MTDTKHDTSEIGLSSIVIQQPLLSYDDYSAKEKLARLETP